MKDLAVPDPVRSARQLGVLGWIAPFSGLVSAAAALVLVAEADRRGALPAWGLPSQVGHVVQAFGTVRRNSLKRASFWSPGLDDSWNRLETGRPILEPLRSGDLVQTGEHSAAEILFFGGNVMHLESGTTASFDESETDVSVRVVMGRALFEVPESLIAGKRIVYRRADGTRVRAPAGTKLVLSVGTLQRIDEAMDVVNVQVEGAPDAFSNIELRLMAHGEEVLDRHPLLVPPIEDRGRDPAEVGLHVEAQFRIPRPEPVFPENDGDVSIEADPNVKFTWLEIESPDPADPVVGYEVVVKPAPGYEVEDTARKVHAFQAESPEFLIERVDGGGVFLWTVRAVTSSGLRSPASAPRWLEIKFPKRLVAPRVLKPKVE